MAPGGATRANQRRALSGDKPPRYIFSFRHRPSVYKSARFAGGEPASRLIGGHIPDRSPGCAFIAMTN